MVGCTTKRLRASHAKPARKWLRWMLSSWVVVGACVAVSTSSLAQSPPVNCDPPDVLLIVDFSNSMNWGLDGRQNSANSKIKLLRQAYQDILQRFDKRIRFGLITYTTTVNQQPPPGRANDHPCSFQSPIVRLEVSVGTNTAQQCISRLNSTRADGCTPMLPAMAKGVEHFRDYVIPRDTIKKRRRFIVMMTDGVPNTGCPGWRDDADSPACKKSLEAEVIKLRNLNVAGANYDIKTYVIGFGVIQQAQGGGLSMDPDTMNAMARAGGTTRYFQANDLAQLRKALETIANNAGGNVEICNNIDDNCDGNIDENIKRTCQGACGAGEQICNKGQWSACSSPPTKGVEVCNNKDDDCDGKVDEDLWKDCPTSGPCGKVAKVQCIQGKWGSCSGGNTPQEVCNGKDDDCDGDIDEGLSRPCRTQCGAGTQACIQGDWSTCTAPQPTTEICDGKDNDCDGTVDNGTTCKGQCVGGICYQQCTQECPQGFICAPNKLCVEKTCNPTCSLEQVCIYGACVPKDCRKEGGRCRSGEACQDGNCVADPCRGVNCGDGLFCSNGQCKVSCAKVTCSDGKVCRNGKCEGDPCAAANCPANQSCFEGRCFNRTCPAQACPLGLVCRDGACVTDLCNGISCPTNQKCFDGECYGPNGPTNADPNKDGGGTGTGNPGSGGNNGGKGCLCSAQLDMNAPSSFPVSLAIFLLLFPFAIRRRFR